MMTTVKNKPHLTHNDYDLSADVEKLKSIIQSATQGMRGKANDLLSDSMTGMKKKSRVVKDGMADYVAEQPFKSLGVTFFIGMAIGYLLHK